MKRRIPRWVLVGLPFALVVMLLGSFLSYRYFQAAPSSFTANGIRIAGNNLPANLKAQRLATFAPVDPRLASAVSSLYAITPSGPLPAPMTIELPLQQAVPAGAPIIVVTLETGAVGSWNVVPQSVLSKNRQSIVFTVRHLSFFEVLLPDIKGMIAEFKKDFVDGITGGLFTTAARPSCTDETGARTDGYQITSSDKDTVFWCFGKNAQDRQLSIVNNRHYVLAATHVNLVVAKGPELQDPLGKLAQFVAGFGHEVLILPADRVDFTVNLVNGTNASVTTMADPASQLLYSLETGLSTMVHIIGLFGGDDAVSIKDLDALLGYAKCFDTVKQSLSPGAKPDLGKVFADCFTTDAVAKVFSGWSLLLDLIVTASDVVAYFRSSVEGVIDIVLQRDQYQIVVSRMIALPCPADAGTCLGVRAADIDGDGQTDQIGLTYRANGKQVVVHVVLANGTSLVGSMDISDLDASVGVSGSILAWLGLSDVNGDGRPEIFIKGSAGANLLIAKYLQFSGGQLKPIAGLPSELIINAGIASPAGITCIRNADKTQLVVFTGQNAFDNTNDALSTVDGTFTAYQADGVGHMIQISQTTKQASYKTFEPWMGANCPGLDRSYSS